MPSSPVILASASPRRKELLEGLGLDVLVRPADVDEDILPNESAKDLVLRLSAAKAQELRSSYPNNLIIAADTVVLLDNKILEKPKNIEENRKFIQALSAKRHYVYGGHSVLFADKVNTKLVTTEVLFRDLSEEEIDWYVNTKEGLDKAGGYGIQGKGAALVDRIDGCYFNVMGLSVSNVVKMAKEIGARLV